MALLVLGAVMVFSASSLVAAERFGDSAYYLKRHLVWLTLGMIGMLAAFSANSRMLKAIARPGFVLVGILILLTLFSPWGVELNHARRWLRLGSFTFQPSELAKPILVFYIASYIARKGVRLKELGVGFLPIALTIGSVILLLLEQPDFGMAVTLAATLWIMLFVGRAKFQHLAGAATMTLMAGYFLILTSPYRKERLLAFLNPWEDPRGSGFQIIQSFIAFQRGGWTGQGLGDGHQKLLFLPEAHTDFIYSVVAEEFGFVGAVLVIALFAVIVVQGFRLSLRIQDAFASQVALGLSALIGMQAFFNMAVVMGLVPTKGLTLPLVSYGGSSLIATMISIGVLLSFSSTVTFSGRMAQRRVK